MTVATIAFTFPFPLLNAATMPMMPTTTPATSSGLPMAAPIIGNSVTRNPTMAMTRAIVDAWFDAFGAVGFDMGVTCGAGVEFMTRTYRTLCGRMRGWTPPS
jgi:hypothetical protein